MNQTSGPIGVMWKTVSDATWLAIIAREACPKTLILEQNGDAYPCDFYIHSDWKLGNIGTHSLDELLSCPIYDQFLQLKPALPKACQSCKWLHVCQGGCPRNRQWNHANGTVDVDYFCKSYKQLYSYSFERMKQLGDSIRREWSYYRVKAIYKGKLPGRNDACPFGSGRKYKFCCIDIDSSAI
jgi:uncharacterized protein